MGNKKLLELSGHRDNNISTEMIAFQNNDKVVKELSDTFTEIMSSYKTAGYSDSISFFKNKKTADLFKNIDDIVYDRFGIKIQHIASEAGNYGVFTAPPPNFNILNKDIETVFEEVKDFTADVNEKSKDSIKSFDADYMSVYKHWGDSIDAIDKLINAEGIKIDLEKAKIHNLPKSYVCFVLCNLDFLINKVDVSPLEMTAILLHEVGHAFTHIEYAYRTYISTSVLIDSIKDTIKVKNKTPKDTLILAYEKTLNKPIGALKDKNEISIAIQFIDEYFKSNASFMYSTHGVTDSEQLADQFASKFGLGKELAFGLSKLYTNQDSTFIYILKMAAAIGIFMMIYAFICTFVIGLALSAGMFTFIGSFLISYLGLLLESLFTKGSTTTGVVYDNNKQRMQRIRNELVRSIRLSKLEPSMFKPLIDSIDQLDTLISKMKSNSDNPFDNILSKMFSSGRHQLEIKVIEEMTENLMENNLYLSSLKLKSL